MKRARDVAITGNNEDNPTRYSTLAKIFMQLCMFESFNFSDISFPTLSLLKFDLPNMIPLSPFPNTPLARCARHFHISSCRHARCSTLMWLSDVQRSQNKGAYCKRGPVPKIQLGSGELTLPSWDEQCDETWPECDNCARKGAPCPGPTQLLKFIMNQDHSTPQSMLRRAGYLRKSQNAAQAAGMQLHPHSSLQSIYKPTSSGPNTGPLRPALVTVDDGVAARLVGHLGISGKDQMITQTEILRHLPKRMSANQSLRDSVDLLCSVWSSRRSGRAAEEFITMPLYGKAIRSLSRILKTDQAFTMETLAAILIMQRAEALFDPGHRPLIHSKGIATLLGRVGAPKKGDKFHASVFAETYSVMVCCNPIIVSCHLCSVFVFPFTNIMARFSHMFLHAAEP